MNKFLRKIIISFLTLALLIALGVGLGYVYSNYGSDFLNTYVSRTQKPSPTAEPTAEPSPTPSPTPEPTPTPSPSPSSTPKPKKQSSTPVESNSCAQYKPENGQVFVRVNLVLRSGSSVVGRTVIRVKPTGTCPGESETVEHWLESGEMSWTTPGLNPGRYRIEVANGNYQGVIAESQNLVRGGYEITIGIDGE